MKKIILSTIFLLLIVTSFCQIPTNTKLTKDNYLQKSKKQKTIAWILFGGGTAMAVGGAIAFSHNWDYGSNSATDISGFVMLGGIVADIVSFPFFVSAHKNKGRAASVTLIHQNILLPEQKTFVFKTQPALKLKIEL